MSHNRDAAFKSRFLRSPRFTRQVVSKVDQTWAKVFDGNKGIKYIEDNLVTTDIHAADSTLRIFRAVLGRTRGLGAIVANSFYAASFDEFKRWIRMRETSDWREPIHPDNMLVDWDVFSRAILLSLDFQGFQPASLYRGYILKKHYDDGRHYPELVIYVFDTLSPERPTIMDIFSDSLTDRSSDKYRRMSGVLDCKLERIGSRTPMSAHEQHILLQDYAIALEKEVQITFKEHVAADVEAHVGLYRWQRGTPRPYIKGVEQT